MSIIAKVKLFYFSNLQCLVLHQLLIWASLLAKKVVFFIHAQNKLKYIEIV